MATAFWYVIYVRSQHEKKVVEALAQMQIEHFCPFVEEVRQWSDRKKTVQVPLFKSYVFVKLPERDRNLVFRIAGVVRYVFWLGQPAKVREAEIETIKKWLNDDTVERITLERYVPGRVVKIKSGVFAEQEAIIRQVGKKRLKMELVNLGVVVNAKIKEVV